MIEGLDGIHERKMEMIKLHVPKLLQPAFKDFSGVKNSKIYNAFNDGSAVYLAKAFQKSLHQLNFQLLDLNIIYIY